MVVGGCEVRQIWVKELLSLRYVLRKIVRRFFNSSTWRTVFFPKRRWALSVARGIRDNQMSDSFSGLERSHSSPVVMFQSWCRDARRIQPVNVSCLIQLRCRIKGRIPSLLILTIILSLKSIVFLSTPTLPWRAVVFIELFSAVLLGRPRYRGLKTRWH